MASHSDLEAAYHSFGCNSKTLNIHRDVGQDIGHDAADVGLVTRKHSCCCSDCADKVVHPDDAVVGDKYLGVTGDHCFPEPSATPFAFSDPIIEDFHETRN